MVIISWWCECIIVVMNNVLLFMFCLIIYSLSYCELIEFSYKFMYLDSNRYRGYFLLKYYEVMLL